MPQQSFAALGVSPPVAGALAERGMTEPFAIQSLVIADVLAGHDVLAQAPTGSGKTLAFAVPIVERTEPGRGPSALVLVPTRELASQVAEETMPIARARGLRVTAVYGGVSITNQARVVGRADILVATPGRLEDLLGRRLVSLEHVRTLVLDEADRMLDMGFQPQVDRIVARVPSARQTLFFSATLEGEAGRLARAYTRGAREHRSAAPVPTHDGTTAIEHRFVAVSHESKVDALVAALGEQRGLALVFVRTRRGADRLAKRLEREGVPALAMHGDKTQAAREKALARFAAGTVDTLVATDVAARGIDVAGISHVINYDAPEDRDGYVHRVGRTGRAGRTGVGITFVVAEQEREMARIATSLSLGREFEHAGFRTSQTRPATDRPRRSTPSARPSRPASPSPAARGSRPRRRR
jgi:superfamily II DNA/RNA helicase